MEGDAVIERELAENGNAYPRSPPPLFCQRLNKEHTASMHALSYLARS